MGVNRPSESSGCGRYVIVNDSKKNISCGLWRRGPNTRTDLSSEPPYCVWSSRQLTVFTCSTDCRICSTSVQCAIFDKFLQVFDIWHAQTCTQMNCTSIDWHTQFKFWHAVWLVKIQTHTSADTLRIEMARVVQRVTSRWQFRRKMYMSIDILYLFQKTSRDTLDLKLNVSWNLSSIHIAFVLVIWKVAVKVACLIQLLILIKHMYLSGTL